MRKEQYHNVLVIAGTGRESGKTTLACLILEIFRHLKPAAIKISPHFHEPAEGLINWHIDNNYNIYLETITSGNKDTVRMLNSGAHKAYYIQAYDRYVKEAFNLVNTTIPAEVPVICESPSLGKYIDPGILFITDSEKITSKKDISNLLTKADLIINSPHPNTYIEKLLFSGGRWILR